MDTFQQLQCHGIDQVRLITSISVVKKRDSHVVYDESPGIVKKACPSGMLTCAAYLIYNPSYDYVVE